MLGLFKEKLNISDHKDIINYLIIEEAEQQWNFHKENNFAKDSFRGITFSKQTISMFIGNILKMKVNEELLLSIVDLGFRRAMEIIDEYQELKKKISNQNKKDFEKDFIVISKYTDFYLKQHEEIKNYNQIISQSGYKSIDFQFRSNVYQIMCQNIRNLDLYIMILKKKYTNDKNKLDEALKKSEDWFIDIGAIEQQKLIKKYEEKVYATVNSRNKNNLVV